jgi:DNA replication protein DnaC
LNYDPFAECNQSEESLNIFRKFSKDLSGFMLLAGKNGTGKSFAARCIMDASGIYDSDFKMFITQAQLNLKWQKQIADWGETNFLLQQVIQTQLLVLDDIGTRTPTDSFMDFLYAIVDLRYNRRCATIITTNLNSKDMRARFGDAFVSRVASGIVLKFEGNDRRFEDKSF